MCYDNEPLHPFHSKFVFWFPVAVRRFQAWDSCDNWWAYHDSFLSLSNEKANCEIINSSKEIERRKQTTFYTFRIPLGQENEWIRVISRRRLVDRCTTSQCERKMWNVMYRTVENKNHKILFIAGKIKQVYVDDQIKILRAERVLILELALKRPNRTINHSQEQNNWSRVDEIFAQLHYIFIIRVEYEALRVWSQTNDTLQSAGRTSTNSKYQIKGSNTLKINHRTPLQTRVVSEWWTQVYLDQC